jgi:hypothetical protein
MVKIEKFGKSDYITKCSFCNGNHNSRNCDIEQFCAPIFKKEVGIYMEEHITQNITCPRCNNNKLYKLGNHTPSIDLVCTECSHIYEVKSKCLSVKDLPNDIFCNGGNYNELINNIKNKELDLIIVLYGVNREKKEIFIREILYADNNMLNDNNHKKNIIISKKNDNQLSSIEIKNKDKLKKLCIKNTYLSFKNLYEVLIKKLS